MANHVSNYLSIEGELNEAGKKVWQEFVLDRLDQDNYLTQFAFENEDDYDRGEMCDKIGAKWAYAEDHHEDGVSVTSAWSPVGPWAEMVAKKLGEVDPNVNLSLTYEDEGLNFIGVCTYDKEGEDTDRGLDYEEIKELVTGESMQLQEWWDADIEDWKEEHEEEAHDLFNDLAWETVNDWQQENKLWSIRDLD